MGNSGVKAAGRFSCILGYVEKFQLVLGMY